LDFHKEQYTSNNHICQQYSALINKISLPANWESENDKKDNVRESVVKEDSKNQIIKWFFTENAETYLGYNNTRKLHNWDFVFFHKTKTAVEGADFCLVRIDPSNYFTISAGSDNTLVGTTYLIISSENLRIYSESFKKLWNNAYSSFSALAKSDSTTQCLTL